MKETSDSELKAVMKSGSDYANQQIKEKQAQMRDFIQQTGNKRDYFREQNYGRVTYVNKFQNGNIGYMSRFTPKYSDYKQISAGSIQMQVKKVSNSRFNMFTDIEADRKNKAVRLAEKIF